LEKGLRLMPTTDARAARTAPARERLLAAFRCAVEAVSAEAVMPARLPDSPDGRLVVVAAGKAAAEMMRVAAARSAAPVTGLVVTRYDHVPAGFALAGVELIEAGHPTPDENSVRAASRALDIAHGLGPGDRLLVLLSGGGSALLAAPAPGVSLADKQELTRQLLRSGASIGEINTVRKHLSRIKGGRLAAAAAPARVTSWLISDVPGDDPAFVASGPTVPDRTSLADARAILVRYGIVASPAATLALADPANEAPPPDSAGLADAETRIIGRAGDALRAAAALVRANGYEVTDLGDRLEGEARRLGTDHAALALRLKADGGRRAIISGGEATVTVADPQGRGGRNLEYALALALGLDGAAGIVALACDTDGIDGTEDAAGAMVFADTLERARALGLDAADCLARNDAYSFFEAIGDLVVTGPTLTNVNDFRLILVDPDG
jgi:hydroxypyruvate reductase